MSYQKSWADFKAVEILCFFFLTVDIEFAGILHPVE